MLRPLYRHIASTLDAYRRCQQTGNKEWEEKHKANIERWIEREMPHGAGFDCGTKLLWDESTPEKLVFQADFHHMDDNGMYAGWTEHKVIVRPSLAFGFTLRITGRDWHAWKEYAYETFDYCLRKEVE